MQAEGLQRGGAASAPEDGEPHAALGHLSRLRVELHPLRVLDAAQVAALRLPNLLHAGAVDQRDAHAVRHLPVGVQHLPEEPLRLRRTPGTAATVASQLLGRQPDLLGVPPPLRGPLGLFQAGYVLAVPLEDGEGQPGHEEAVELVAVGGDAPGKAPHEVPHVQPHHQLSPLVVHLMYR